MAELNGYVICEYNSLWWLALVMETCDNDGIKVQFHPSGPSPSFSFPKRQDELIVSHSHILMKVSTNTSLTGRVYKISHEDTVKATRLLHEFCCSST